MYLTWNIRFWQGCIPFILKKKKESKKISYPSPDNDRIDLFIIIIVILQLALAREYIGKKKSLTNVFKLFLLNNV